MFKLTHSMSVFGHLSTHFAQMSLQITVKQLKPDWRCKTHFVCLCDGETCFLCILNVQTSCCLTETWTALNTRSPSHVHHMDTNTPDLNISDSQNQELQPPFLHLLSNLLTSTSADSNWNNNMWPNVRKADSKREGGGGGESLGLMTLISINVSWEGRKNKGQRKRRKNKQVFHSVLLFLPVRLQREEEDDL